MEEILDILNGLGLDADFEHCTTLIDDGILESLDIVTIIAELSDAFRYHHPGARYRARKLQLRRSHAEHGKPSA